MTAKEFKNHPEYAKCMEKIRSYRKGFEFTISYYQMTQGQINAMRMVLRDAVEEGLIESIASYLSIECIETKETFRRI